VNHKHWCLGLLVAATTISIAACSSVNSQLPQGMGGTTASPTISPGTHDGRMNQDGMSQTSGGMKHNMDVGPANTNYDLRFLDSMIPHHQGALVMSQEVLAKSKRPELIKLAKSIITEQKKEITQMQIWRKQWYPKASSTPIMWHAEMNHEMAMTPQHKEMMMMSMSLGAADAGFDRRFLDAMIPHHEGAVTMGKDLLQKSKRPEMQKLAKNIISSQQQEIDRMNQWRKQWYGK
jgi:uncharacterized protein (DUF305 family)